MRQLSGFLILALAGWLCLQRAPAQDPARILYSKSRAFRIPYTAGANEANLKQLQLFYSLDQGKSWQPAAVVAPREGAFRFAAERDGLYWFTVQTTDLQNRLFPPSLDGADTRLKVIVDTQPPTVTLDPLPPRGGEVGVAWTVRDENLALALPDAVSLEYLPAGARDWLPLAINPAANQHYFPPQSAGPVRVRLRARDQAGNLGEALTTVAPGGQAPAPPERPQEVAGAPLDPNRKLVNSKRISLDIDIQGEGKSGTAAIDLWWTQDARTWNRYPTSFTKGQKPTFDVIDEGVYGITLLAKSGVGLSDRPPQLGDPPQLWIEVDTTKPEVLLHGVTVGTGADKGKLGISWSARDKNLDPTPITLSYRGETGDWTPFAARLKNTGQHTWKMPDDLPYQFHIKVEAVDRAGNVGEAATADLVKVDLQIPKVQIRAVEPAGK